MSGTEAGISEWEPHNNKHSPRQRTYVRAVRGALWPRNCHRPRAPPPDGSGNLERICSDVADIVRTRCRYCFISRRHRRRTLVNEPQRGEVWWGEIEDLGRRPLLVMTRSVAIPVLNAVLLGKSERMDQGTGVEGFDASTASSPSKMKLRGFRRLVYQANATPRPRSTARVSSIPVPIALGP